MTFSITAHSIMTFSISTLCITTFNRAILSITSFITMALSTTTLSITIIHDNDNQKNGTQRYVMLSITFW